MKIHLPTLIIVLCTFCYGLCAAWLGFFLATIWSIVTVALVALYLKLTGRI